MDNYTGFDELKLHEREGVDYLIVSRRGNSSIAVMAIHGGGIEPGTVDIADGIAGADHAFYAFKGIKPRGNAALHITSNRFDEPTGLAIARQAETVVSIHGHHASEQIVYVGGLDQALKLDVVCRLSAAGFRAEESFLPGLKGRNPDNICNRCRSGKGVQLEISEGLRRQLLGSLTDSAARNRTDAFCRFVMAVRQSLC